MKNQGNKKYWKKEANRLFSLYIRQRDANKQGIVKCCTCNKKAPWRYVDCGHFMSRVHEATLYHPKNASGQCKLCNGIQSGRQYEHSIHLNKKWGPGTSEKIRIKSKIACKRSWIDYYIIAQEYLELLKEYNYEIR